MKVKTEKVYHGWYAYDDNSYDGTDDSIIGWGETEAEAITDLNEQHEDQWQAFREAVCRDAKEET